MKRFVALAFVVIMGFAPVLAQGEIVQIIVEADSSTILEATQEAVDKLEYESNSGGGVDPQQHIRWLWYCSGTCVFACAPTTCIRSGASCVRVGLSTVCQCDEPLCS